jgi:hypothetical protein
VLFLIGESTSERVTRVCEEHGWGRMWVNRRVRPVMGELWGLDNGAFGAWKRGESWDESRWLKKLDGALSAGNPYLVVAPDILGLGEMSLSFSSKWLQDPRLPKMLPWYLALQDGMTEEMVKPYLGGFSGLFMGGTNDFKPQAPSWCRFAHSMGMRFHYARCSSVGTMHWCRNFGADSADSTQPLWSNDKFNRFLREYLSPREIRADYVPGKRMRV